MKDKAIAYIVIQTLFIFACSFEKKYEKGCIPLDEYVYTGGKCSGIDVTAGINPYDNSTIIANVNSYKYFISSDSGVTWEETNLDKLLPFGVSTEGYHPQNKNIIYRPGHNGRNYGDIELSIDGGDTWEKRNSFLKGTNTKIHLRHIYYHPVNPNTIYVLASNLLTNTSSLYVSDDSGDSFTLSLDVHNPKLAISRSDPNIMYALAARGGNLYKSIDEGNTWELVLDGPKVKNIVQNNSKEKLSGSDSMWLAVHPTNPDIVYVLKQIGIMKTSDGGRNWCMIPTPNLTRTLNHIFIDPNDSSVIFVSSRCGLFKSSNNGMSWEGVNIHK